MLGGLWVNINKAHFTYRFLDDPDELYYTNGASFSIVEQECVDHQNKDNDAVLLQLEWEQFVKSIEVESEQLAQSTESYGLVKLLTDSGLYWQYLR